MLELELRTVSTMYIRALLRVVEQYQVDIPLLLDQLDLHVTELENSTARINAKVVYQLWEKALQLTGDQALGIRLAQSFKIASFRTLGMAAMSSATLLQSIQILLRYHRLVSDVGAFTALTSNQGEVIIYYTEQLKSFSLLPQQIEAIIGSMLCQARQLAEQPIVPVSLHFKHAPQVDIKIYQEFFGITPQFYAQDYFLGFSLKDMQTVLPHADSEFCQIHCDIAERQLARMPVGRFVTAFAVQWLANTVQLTGLVHIHNLAQAMQISTRTLQRLLADEGTNWSQVVNEARCKAAKQLLQQDLSLEEVAQRLGYHDASSLSRAAKHWFGMTAGQYRMYFKH
ncbi:MAG: AraC family transcriptional regulator [Moraxellaceae bacterium]|nr:MAG: AraC family transcriptional regulator [Moraxellaceae bacterium]